MAILSTTICAVRKDGRVAISGDGQATQGETIVLKANVKKVRKLYEGKIIGGFAGSTADALTLSELLEGKLKEYGGDLTRASVELAKQWRTDKYLRNLNAVILVTNGKDILMVTGDGNVLEPDGDAMAIGSGGSYALSAARAYLDSGAALTAEEISRKSLSIAADICVYTNHNIITEVL